MKRLLIVAILGVGLHGPCRAAVQLGQTWLLGSETTLVHSNGTVALRAGDRFEVIAADETWVHGRCRRGSASVEGRIEVAALETALTSAQFETLRAAMTAYVYSEDENVRARAAEAIGRFQRAGVALVELAVSRIGRPVKHSPTGPQRLTARLSDGTEGEYYVVLPQGYDPSKRYPLILCLHPNSGEGKYYRHWNRGGTAVRSACILVSPTSPHPERGSWDSDPAAEIILAALRATMRDYAVNPWRVYAEGFSMGGFASTYWAQVWPDRFAAVGAQACCFWIPDGDMTCYVENLRTVPVFLAVGEDDYPQNVAGFRELGAALTRLETPHVLKILPNTGHALTRTESELLAFLAKYSRNLYPPTISYYYITRPARSIQPEWAYWLRIREASNGGHVEARVQGNTITVTTEGVRRFDLYLSDRLVDLDKPVTVVANGDSVHTGPVEPDVLHMLDVIRETGDRARIYSAKVEVKLR